MKKAKSKVRYSCVVCSRVFDKKSDAEKCYNSHPAVVKCNFCNKELQREIEEGWTYGGQIFEKAIDYGSALDGEYLAFVMCDECMEKYLVGKCCLI